MPVSRSNFLPMPGYSGVTSYTLLKLYYYNIRGWHGVASGAGGVHAGRLASCGVKSLGGRGGHYRRKGRQLLHSAAHMKNVASCVIETLTAHALREPCFARTPWQNFRSGTADFPHLQNKRCAFTASL